MNIHFITSRDPFYQTGGDSVRLKMLIEYFGLRGDSNINLHIISRKKNGFKSINLDNGKVANIYYYKVSWITTILNLMYAILTGKSLQEYYFYSSFVKRKISKNLTSCNLLVCVLVRMYRYVPSINCYRILEATDYLPLTYSLAMPSGSLYSKLLSFIYKYEQSAIKNCQIEAARLFDLVTVVSERDRLLFINDVGRSNEILVLKNSIHTEDMLRYQITYGAPNLLFIGNLRTLQNLQGLNFFISLVLPKLVELHDNLKLIVVGPNSESLTIPMQLSNKIICTGVVDDLGKCASSATIGICPIFIGAGMQNKVIDYMKYGIPSVITSVAAKGIGGREEIDYMLANTAQEFIDVINLLLLDGKKRNALSLNAHNFLKESFSFANEYAKIESLLNKIDGA